MTCLIQIWPRTSTILQVTPEALPKFHRWIPSRSCKGRVKSYVCRTRWRLSFDNIHATLTMDIQDSSGYAGGAALIQLANAINDMSHPNLTTNIHNFSSNAGGAAQIPQVNALKKMWRANQVLSMLHIQIWPQTSTIFQVTPEALPKFHRWKQSMSSFIPIRP